jgi:hypothetical protein
MLTEGAFEPRRTEALGSVEESITIGIVEVPAFAAAM